MERSAGRRRSKRPPKSPADAGRESERLHERLPDAACDGGVIARVGPARCIQRSRAVQPREVDGVAGARGKLLQVLELRAAVALAERVDMVDVASTGPAPSANPSGPDPRKYLAATMRR